MHHSLPIYSRYRELFLRYYIFQAKWTKIPLIGNIVRWVANLYGSNMSRAYLLTLDEAKEIIDSASGLALGPCTCREVFKNCDNPINAEIMIGLNRNIFVQEREHDYREISKEEAKSILGQCHQNSLLHTIVKYRNKFYAICNCCACCCVPLRLNKKYGIGSALIRDGNIVETVKKQLECY
ncbi:MAG: ferredoxin-like protein [Dehalococcoidia bacterium]|nr:MAG: ferredoxin-like protein [Dehalococcoidia bacterium]